MKRVDCTKGFVICLLMSLYLPEVANGQDFEYYHSWDFESELIGNYTDDEIKEDFDIVYLFSHNSSEIVMDEINGTPTKVLKITHEAQKTSVGFQTNIDLGKDYDELYFSYNIKLSKNWNSTAGGKLPGFGSLPPYPSGSCPDADDGFGSINLFKQAGKIFTYHYDHTKGYCPWSGEEYYFDSTYISNNNWYNITQRIVMNTFTNGVANNDGIKELWIDGRLIHQESNLKLMLVENDSMKIDAIRISNFYGGGGEEYEPITECYAYFDNFCVYKPINDPTFGTHNLHSTNEKLSTPDEIIERDFSYDQLIISEQEISNSEYGKPYSPCMDEVYVIDAGEGNIVDINWDHTIGGGDFLFFYDGKRTDSNLLKLIAGYSNKSDMHISSSTRYLTIRFSTNIDGGTTGWKGIISFNSVSNDDPDPSPALNHPPTIENRDFIIKQEKLSGSFIGRIPADDPDEGQLLSFSIEEGNESEIFFLEPGTGDLSITDENVFDLSELEYNLTVKVEDDGEIPESNTAEVTVTFIKSVPPTVYIDPENKNDVLEDGSPDHPFNSWSDVQWEEGYRYLQKRGTRANESKVSIYADNVELGAYGEGEKPVIVSNSEETALKLFSKTDVSIRNLHVIAEKAISCIYIYGAESDKNLIDNCTIEGGENGIRVIDGKSVTICYNTIKNCSDAIYSYAQNNKIYYNVLKFNI
ncbi:MAG: cadherin domain-containing protein, partial [Bacteroidales bacterium]